MKKTILGVTAAAALAVAGWTWASPNLALAGLRDALIEGDKEELTERIDFPAVKDSLKSQVKARMMAEMAKEKDNPFAGFGMMMANAMIDPLIDGIVSPDGLKTLALNGRLQARADEQGEAAGARTVEWTIERDGFDRFHASPKVDPGETGPKLSFRRDGIGWKLVDIEVPQNPPT